MSGCGHRPRADGEDEVCLACQLGGDLTRHLHGGHGGCSVCDALRAEVERLREALRYVEGCRPLAMVAPCSCLPGLAKCLGCRLNEQRKEARAAARAALGEADG